MKNHDCQNCAAQGDCAIEAYVVEAKKVFAAEGVAGVAKFVMGFVSSPSSFIRALTVALSVIGDNVEGIARLRSLLDELSKDHSPTIQKGIPAAIAIVYMRVRNDTLAKVTSEMLMLAEALGVPSGLGMAHVDRDSQEITDSILFDSEFSPPPNYKMN